MQGHPVFNAASQIEVLGFGKHAASVSLESQIQRQQRCAANHMANSL
jgi:hypothetical protein